MSSDPASRLELAALVAECIPPTALSAVIAAQGVVTGYDDMVKLGPDTPARRDHDVALMVVEAYANKDRTEELVRALVRRDPGNARFVEGVADLLLKKLFASPAATSAQDKAKQAALATRAQMLRSAKLIGFMREVEGHVCVVGVEIITDGQRVVATGTGFLVGPDLVLTARHVLKSHILNGQRNPAQTGRRCVFFDHLDGGPIVDPLVDPLPSGVRRVDFHPTDWLRSSSEDLARDGLFDAAGSDEIAEAQKRLDFVLVRLARPVGNQSRRATGGARRGWIDFWSPPPPGRPAPRPDLLALDDRIIIPQHPNGHPQQIDFGRYKHVDPSSSRIRYDTETDQGTSGAPCFDQNFNLVGVHNAYFDVPLKPRLNQAIRFDRILSCLQGQVAPPTPAPSRLWSASDNASDPQVILGRVEFQAWIERASKDAASLADRAFVVEGPRAKSGKTFSAKILHAARRDRHERIVLFSCDKNAVPQSASDFIRILATQLRVPEATLNEMPVRPSEQLPASGDGDKLLLWQSKDLPQWFAHALAVTRMHAVDVRAEALALVDLLRSRNIPPTAEDVILAELPEPRIETRSLWDRVWIVLDDVDEASVSAEVKELIASLLGIGLGETAIAEELRRLRWAFLGWRPEFLDGIVDVESLDQTAIGDAEVQECVATLVDSLNRKAVPSDADNALQMVEFARLVPDLRRSLDDPLTRLGMLQRIIATIPVYFASRGSP